MGKPATKRLLDFHAVRSGEENAKVLAALIDHQQGDVKELEARIKKLQKLTLFLFCRVLGKGKIDKPGQLVALYKAKAADRNKQFEALGIAEDDLSQEDFEWICRCAAEVY